MVFERFSKNGFGSDNPFKVMNENKTQSKDKIKSLETLKNRLFNHFRELFKSGDDPNIPGTATEFFVKDFIDQVEKKLIPDNSKTPSDFYRYLKAWFLDNNRKQSELFEYIEFLDAWFIRNRDIANFANINYSPLSVNEILEKESDEYRLINGSIVELSRNKVSNSVPPSIRNTKPFFIAQGFLKRAKDNIESSSPDYRQSITESIGAVEAVLKEITGAGVFVSALELLGTRGIQLHPLLRDALFRLYSYAQNDSTNISRPDKTGHSREVYSEDAIFMQSIASSFVAYLIEKDRRAEGIRRSRY
jgi:hypothetical protein